jgi:hypothetical protein
LSSQLAKVKKINPDVFCDCRLSHHIALTDLLVRLNWRPISKEDKGCPAKRPGKASDLAKL